MKYAMTVRTASLLLLIGAVFPAAAQKSGAGKPDGHEAKQGKPSQDKVQQSHEREVKHNDPAQKPGSSGQTNPSQKPPKPIIEPSKDPSHQKRSVRQYRAWQRQKGWAKNGGWKGQKSWKAHRSDNWKDDHYTWVQRGGYGGYYIPHYHYVKNYGPGNYFRMRGRPVMYMGYPRFYHRDYSYIMVDPWPSTWQENWYEKEDVYIVYDEGYYLHNRSDPSVGIAISMIR